TGYDLSKLIAGSFGTLAAVTEITVKTLPAPEETRTVMLRGLDDATALAAIGACDIVGRDDSLTRWRQIRDAMPLANLADHAIWRLSVPPSVAPSLVATLSRQLSFRHFYDWAGGLVWLAVADASDGGAAAIRAALPEDNGHATLLRAGDAMREAVPVFQ